MKVLLPLGALGIAGLGWVGSRSLEGVAAIGYLGGALTLAGALVICMMFAVQTRWLGVGGAAVVALLGIGRNVPAVLEVAGGGAAAWCRLGIAAVCVVVAVLAGRVLLVERRGGGR